MTFPASSACSLSKNKSDELMSSSHPGYFHTDFMLLPGHLVNMQGSWMAIWRALQHATGNRWEKHERSGVSQWNESLPYYYPILSYFKQKVHATNLSCVTFDHLVYDLPHYAREALVGRWCSQAEEVGQGKDENIVVGWFCTFPFTNSMKSDHVVHC